MSPTTAPDVRVDHGVYPSPARRTFPRPTRSDDGAAAGDDGRLPRAASDPEGREEWDLYDHPPQTSSGARPDAALPVTDNS